VLVRHEQAATHAADGYARATGKPGVVLVTSGPGATNAVTGIATAYMDSIPMVVLSGQVQSHLIGEDAFQETDMLGISRPIVKHSFQVRARRDSSPGSSRRPFISLPAAGPARRDRYPQGHYAPDERFEYVYPDSVKLRSYSPAVRGHSGQMRKAAKLLLSAKRPSHLLRWWRDPRGGQRFAHGARPASELPGDEYADGAGCLSGIGPQFLGMLGMHGFYEANMAMHHSDVILAVGARFDDRVTNTVGKFCPGAKIIHIDVDPAAISKTVSADIPIVGPVTAVLTDLIAAIRQGRGEREPLPDPAALEKLVGADRGVAGKHGLWTGRRFSESEHIMPQEVIQSLYRVTDGDAYVTSDVGQHQMFAAQYYKFDKPRRWINSGRARHHGLWSALGDGCQAGLPGCGRRLRHRARAAYR
jgi:acetolactate synthase-1/2/3 large subunit